MHHALTQGVTLIYTTIGELSSKDYVFLAERSQFDSDHGVDLYAPTCCQSVTFVRPLFAFYCPLCFTKKILNNVAFRHRPLTRCLRCATDGSAKLINCAARTAGSSHGRLIARWRHGRCFYSTRGPTGSLVVM